VSGTGRAGPARGWDGVRLALRAPVLPLSGYCPPVAEAVVQALAQAGTTNKAFAISSTEGEGPGQDAGAWQRLFASAPAGGSS
jgi:hypothetical protein